MVGCIRYCAAEAQFDRKVAERDLRRYRRRGADATTRLMLAELRRWPLEGRQLLDVGGGIGVISAELAGAGLAGVTVVEASPAYLEVARREIGTRYESRPTKFVLGDFVRIAAVLTLRRFLWERQTGRANCSRSPIPETVGMCGPLLCWKTSGGG
jgi:SAM-dependent methyltransferase